jgi:hypothetical protein
MGMNISPDGRALLLTQNQQNSKELVLVENFW